MNAPLRASALVSMLGAAGQDFEFYPTTNEIIAALVADINDPIGETRHHRSYSSVLDIGAGTGKVLLALREGAKLYDMHAIEKSQILCEQMHPDILIVGTDFAEQSLLSKNVDVLFSNPPYSEFEAWATKIIRQAASSVIYLVLPIRWQNSTAINDAIKYRDADCIVIGDFDFEDAEDRRARAKVHLLRIDLPRAGHRESDAFERFFNEQFAHLISKFGGKGDDEAPKSEDTRFTHLVVGPSYLEALVSLYDAEIAKVQSNLDMVSKLDVGLLRELKVSPASIMACLKERLAGLRGDYWNELFSHLDTVTNRLTSKSRQKLLDVLQRHVHVDFTLSNIYAVVVWVIKNANAYIDSQLIDCYDVMVEKCNVVLYKSNQRTWVDDRWRYNDSAPKNSHYALDYRIVTHRIGGCRSGNFSFERGLAENAAQFLGDLLTLAHNLGFNCETVHHSLTRAGRESWAPGELRDFQYTDRTGKRKVLFDVRAFKNGNVHLRLAKSFILALNVEHGRLKGWLRSREEAVTELGDQEAAQYFNANISLTAANTLLLSSPLQEAA